MAFRRLSVWVVVLVGALGAGAYGASRFLGQPRRVIDAYHRWYHDNGATTYNDTQWLGVTVQKSPLDLWVIQEILHEVRPDVVVETGTYRGGSSFYFATLMDAMQHGRIVTIDIEDYPNKPVHPRVEFLLGSSTSAEVVAKVKSNIQAGEKVLVDLDSDHTMEHVLAEMNLYAELVSPGSYLIVEDTHFNGHPILPKHGPGPMEAVEAFLSQHDEFEIDSSREKFGMSFNRRGYLKRVR